MFSSDGFYGGASCDRLFRPQGSSNSRSKSPSDRSQSPSRCSSPSRGTTCITPTTGSIFALTYLEDIQCHTCGKKGDPHKDRHDHYRRHWLCNVGNTRHHCSDCNPPSDEPYHHAMVYDISRAITWGLEIRYSQERTESQGPGYQDLADVVDPADLENQMTDEITQ